MTFSPSSSDAADGSADVIVETGAQFYAPLRARGLHLRRENGRDNALLEMLRRELQLVLPLTQDDGVAPDLAQAA